MAAECRVVHVLGRPLRPLVEVEQQDVLAKTCGFLVLELGEALPFAGWAGAVPPGHDADVHVARPDIEQTAVQRRPGVGAVGLHGDGIAAGAVEVESRELVRRLRAAGLRLTPAQRRARSAHPSSP